MTLPFADARILADSARAHALELGKALSIAVVDYGGFVVLIERNSDPVFFTQVGRMGQHPIVATKGGYTLKRDGAIVGGIGISGGSPDEDQTVTRPKPCGSRASWRTRECGSFSTSWPPNSPCCSTPCTSAPMPATPSTAMPGT